MKHVCRVGWVISIIVLAGTIAAHADIASDTLALNTKFGLKDAKLQFVTGEGGLPCAQIDSKLCSGRIYLQGAHVTAWQPVGQQPVIFMSTKSVFAEGKPMRGGVPICFPWFATKTFDPPGPSHGFARILPWTVESTQADADGTVTIVLSLKSSEKTKAYWPDDFEARYTASFGRDLKLSFTVKNIGTQPMHITEALHAYFNVDDVRRAQVSGLDGAEYLDKVAGRQRKKQAGNVTFDSETDRIYVNAKGPHVIADPGFKREIKLEKSGSDTTIVWNPGETKGKATADIGEENWSHYVAVETANDSDNALTIEPGATHTLAATVSVVPSN